MTDLDRWLAESVMGWELYDPSPEFDDGLDHSSWTMKEHKLWYMPTPDWHPTSDLTQAFMCVNNLPSALTLQLYQLDDKKGWEASINNNSLLEKRCSEIGDEVVALREDHDPALAICKAIKAALSNEKEEPK